MIVYNTDEVSQPLKGEIGQLYFELEQATKKELTKDDYKKLIPAIQFSVSKRTDQQSSIVVGSNQTPTISGSFAFTAFVEEWMREDARQAVMNRYPEFALTIQIEFTKEGELSKNNSKDPLPVYVPIKPKHTFEQLILTEHVKNEILEALCIIEHTEMIYKTWGYEEIEASPRSVLNFYGPPGTGKTMCAHAIAHRLGHPFLVMNYADIESKYVGEAAKNMMVAFETAKRYGAILFFDEADSFLGKRIENVTQGSDQALNSLRSQTLMLLEEFEGVVIFATNLVANIDRAFQSRILKHIQFELPNREARAEIIKSKIPTRLPLERELNSEEYLELSDLIDGFSGREIKGTILEILIRNARKQGSDSQFTYDDFKKGFILKAESLKKLKEEQAHIRKEKIIKALGGDQKAEKEKVDA